MILNTSYAQKRPVFSEACPQPSRTDPGRRETPKERGHEAPHPLTTTPLEKSIRDKTKRGSRAGGLVHLWHDSNHSIQFGSTTRTRTWNLVVNSHPLCRLSYRGIFNESYYTRANSKCQYLRARVPPAYLHNETSKNKQDNKPIGTFYRLVPNAKAATVSYKKNYKKKNNPNSIIISIKIVVETREQTREKTPPLLEAWFERNIFSSLLFFSFCFPPEE